MTNPGNDGLLTGPAITLELKANADTGSRSFSGYAAVFGSVDSGRDLIRRGAFSETLSQWRGKGRLPTMLWQHDMGKPIGRWTEMREDDVGLYVEGRFSAGVQQADEAYALVKDGAIDGLSIGYVAPEGGYEYDRDLGVRILTRIDLWEVSIVTMAMQPAAAVTDVKAADFGVIESLSDAERWLREAAPALSRKQVTGLVSAIKRIAQREADDDRSKSVLLDQIRSIRKSISS